jgi:hypothetical protein
MYNRVIFVMIGIMFFILFIAIPYMANITEARIKKFETACMNLNGDTLKGDGEFFCIKPGSIITMPDNWNE